MEEEEGKGVVCSSGGELRVGSMVVVDWFKCNWDEIEDQIDLNENEYSVRGKSGGEKRKLKEKRSGNERN